MESSKPGRAFPLTLTPFEAYMLADDHDNYPMLVVFLTKFSGVANRPIFLKALTKAAGRHPLFCSKIDTTKRPYSWNPSSEQPFVFTWSEEKLPDSKPRDIRADSSFQIDVFADRSENTTEVRFQFHHSCSDGQGFHQFFSDFLTLYDFFSQSESTFQDEACPNLPTLSPNSLPNRNRFGITFRSFFRVLSQQAVGLTGAIKFLSRKPAPITPCRNEQMDAAFPNGSPVYLRKQFTPEQTRTVIDNAKKANVSVNDRFIQCLYSSIFQWRKDLQKGSSGDWIRISVPINLRTELHEQTSAANIVSMVFLDRKGENSHDERDLQKSIQKEMNLIKRNNLGLTFLFSLKCTSFLPGGIEKSIPKKKCLVSTVLTNLGRPLHKTSLEKKSGNVVAGNLELLNYDALTPLRPYQPIGFAVSTYGNRLSVTANIDPRHLNKSEAEQLFHSFCQRIIV